MLWLPRRVASEYAVFLNTSARAEGGDRKAMELVKAFDLAALSRGRSAMQVSRLVVKLGGQTWWLGGWVGGCVGGIPLDQSWTPLCGFGL